MTRQLLRLSFLLLLGAIHFQTFAQEETIASDRPGQAVSALTVGKSIIQIQSGLNFSNTSADFTAYELNTGIFSNFTDVRYGLSKAFEVQATLGYSFASTDGVTDFSRIPPEISTVNSNGFSVFAIGARYNLLSPRDSKKPTLGVRTNLFFPVSDEFNNDTYVDITFMHSQELFAGIGLSTNLGLSWNPGVTNENTPGITYVINLGRQLGTSDFSAFVEYYGVYVDGTGEFSDGFSHNFDGGLAWLYSKDLQIDFSVGYSKSGDITNWFVDSGVSWRFQTN
ncbi:MAG: transporter [bacterium]|nr:transporter [bacterium]